MNIVEEMKNQATADNFITGSSLDQDQINHNIKIMAEALHRVNPKIRLNIRPKETLHDEVYQIVLDEGPGDVTYLNIKNWGVSNRYSRSSNTTYKGLEIEFSRYGTGTKRIMFKNINKFFAIIEDVAKHLKEMSQKRMSDRIQCWDQNKKASEFFAKEMIEISKRIFKFSVEDNKWFSWNRFTVNSVDFKKSVYVEFKTSRTVQMTIKDKTSNAFSKYGITTANIEATTSVTPEEAKNIIDEFIGKEVRVN